MILRYGSYAWNSNSVKIDSQVQAMMSSGIKYGYKMILQVTGFLEGDGQADLTDKSNAMFNAVTPQGYDLVLYQDSGAFSATGVLATASASSVTITQGPNFSHTPGEYATVRYFSFTAEAEFIDASIARNITVSFKETLSFVGGGPMYIMKRAINGPPQRQLVYPSTEFVVVQSGQAVGLLDYPRFPSAMFPFAENEAARRIDLTGPDKDAKLYKNFTVSWMYEHAWPTRLFGFPNIWY